MQRGGEGRQTSKERRHACNLLIRCLLAELVRGLSPDSPLHGTGSVQDADGLGDRKCLKQRALGNFEVM